ncbi:MAG: sugar phosphate isomerase/epimerase family protein [Litorilinea sp.]
MRLATTGFLPGDLRTLEPAHVQKVRQEGFVGCCCRFADFAAPTTDELHKIRDIIAGEGVGIAQVNGQYEGMVNPDESRRQAGIATFRQAIQVCATLQGDNLYVRPGSINPRGHWTPHPDNHLPATIDRLVDSLTQVTRTAEDAGVILTIEGHVLSPLNTVAMVREVLDRVGSPMLKFNVDPVNFVRGLHDVYDSRPLLDELYDTLGDVAWVVHAKDVDVEDRLVMHIAEVVIGRGRMDVGYYMQRFEAIKPEGYFIIEHLPDDLIPEARDSVLATAEKLGIAWLESVV